MNEGDPKDYEAGYRVGFAGEPRCPDMTVYRYVGWLVGGKVRLADKLLEATERLQSADRRMIQRIIDACNVVRAESQAKLTVAHEQLMIERRQWEMTVGEAAASARRQRDEEWKEALERAGWGFVIRRAVKGLAS